MPPHPRSLAAAVLIITACGDDDTRSRVDVQRIDSAGVSIAIVSTPAESIPEWRLAAEPLWKVTGGETGDSSALSLVGSVRWLGDGRVVIADLSASRLLVYDSTGGFVRPVGRRGRGPGEFLALTSLTAVRGDTLAVFDAQQRRLNVISADSGMVRQVSLVDDGSLESWPANAWPWRDSLVLVLQLATTPRPNVATGATVQRWPMRAQLTLRDLRNREVAAGPVFAGSYTGVHDTGDTRLPFANAPFVAVGASRIIYGSGATFAFTALDSTLQPVAVTQIRTLDEPLSAEEVDAVREEVVRLLARRMPIAQARERLSANFHPDILPQLRPPIGRALIDAEGNHWLERFEPWRLGNLAPPYANSWTIVLPDGRLAGRLMLPEDTRLEDVRGGRALVVQRDSLDVESVAEYRIQR